MIQLTTLYLTGYTVKQVNNNIRLMDMYLDSTKAFDTLDHIIHLKSNSIEL